MTIDNEDIIALIEDGPKPAAQLATWLNAPVDAVLVGLRSLRRLGMVKQVGTAKQWALASYVARRGREVVVDQAPRRERILELLRDRGVLGMADFKAATGWSQQVLIVAVRALKDAKQIRSIGPLRSRKYAIVGDARGDAPRATHTQTFIPTAKPATWPKPDPDPIDADGDGDDEYDVDTPALRQPHERPPRISIDPNAPPSWWCQASRDGFTSTVERDHFERMRVSAFGRTLVPRVLGAKLPRATN